MLAMLAKQAAENERRMVQMLQNFKLDYDNYAKIIAGLFKDYIKMKHSYWQIQLPKAKQLRYSLQTKVLKFTR